MKTRRSFFASILALCGVPFAPKVKAEADRETARQISRANNYFFMTEPYFNPYKKGSEEWQRFEDLQENRRDLAKSDAGWVEFWNPAA